MKIVFRLFVLLYIPLQLEYMRLSVLLRGFIVLVWISLWFFVFFFQVFRFCISGFQGSWLSRLHGVEGGHCLIVCCI